MVFVHVASISLFSELEANVQDSVGRQMGLRLLMKFAGKPCSCLLSKHDLMYLPSLTYIHPVLCAVQYQEKQFLLLSPLGVDALYHAKQSVENTEGLFDEFQFKVMQLKPARPSPKQYI